MMIETIYQQLKDYCDCVEDFTKQDVQEIVNAISLATCWTKKPCETFLQSDRKEVVKLPSCVDCAFEFEPFYTPFVPASFTFTLVKQEGTTEELITVTDYIYSDIDGMFRINLPLPKCECMCKCSCGCDPVYKLLVEYVAGYEDIPVCILPVFCNLLDVVHAKNTCDCDDCQTCDTKYDEDNGIKYAKGDIVTVQLETDLGKILVEQYKKQLSLMSLCNKQVDMWGIVV